MVTKYEDANRNGRFDAGEKLLSGWTFRITDSQGTTVATVTTGSNGTATAVNLAPGSYTITETTQSGWVSTDPGGSKPSKTVTMVASQTVGVGFGNAKIQLPSTSTADDSNGVPTSLLLLGLAALLFTAQSLLKRKEHIGNDRT